MTQIAHTPAPVIRPAALRSRESAARTIGLSSEAVVARYIDEIARPRRRRRTREPRRLPRLAAA